jgi:hypothetical protein
MASVGRAQPQASLRNLCVRLEACRQELEQAALARIKGISDPVPISDPSYVAGLRTAVMEALEYGLGSLDDAGEEPPPVPIALLAQARRAARAGVSLQIVLRRYAAGHRLLADRLLDEAAAAGVGAPELKAGLRALAVRHDSVVAAVSEDYERETAVHGRGPERRRVALISRLLAGEPLDPRALGYGLDGHHLAIVALGEGVTQALKTLGKQVDRRLLLVEPDLQSAWAWLGGAQPFAEHEVGLVTSFSWPKDSAVVCGEPAQGAAGWRLGHRQAAAALSVAQCGPVSFVRYSDVALLTAALHDEVLATSLRRRYLAPLQGERDDGTVARATLRAYFSAARNISSAAAALGVDRRTVGVRLCAIEERLGRPLHEAASELEVALQLDELERSLSRSAGEAGVAAKPCRNT